jgi:hypothetical protein
MRFVLAIWVVLTVGLLAGCGGGSAPAPATTPPPAPAPAGGAAPPASSPTIESAVEAMKHTAGYRDRIDMTAPENDKGAITSRAVYLYFWPDTSRVWFRLENRIGTPIKILWNEMRFTNPFGETYPMMHEGITYDRRNDPQNYYEVPGFGRTADWFAPMDLLEDPRSGANRQLRPLLPTDASALDMVGRNFAADFVLEIEGQRAEHRLVWRIASVIPPQ